MLLIISMQNDFHVDYLLERMTGPQRENTIVFCTETFPISSHIVLTNDIKSSFISTAGKKIYLSQIHSIWYRRPARPVIDLEVTDTDAREYARRECQDALSGLWEEISHCIWVSKPSAIRNASHKWEQIRRAKRVGISTPKTLITNNPERAREFCRGVKRAVVKAISRSVFLHNDRYEAAYTSLIDSDDSLIDDVIFAPCIFQEYVPKSIELRITVVKKQVFACAIYSQKSEKTLHDWRNYDFENVPHESWRLPKDLETKCVNLVKSYGLNFGAIDMVLTPQNEYVFLELNPNGQWAWIDELTNLPIAEVLIEVLFPKGPT